MILIKTMTKPKTCAQCRLKDYAHSECIVTGRRVSTWGMKTGVPIPEWCPIVAVDQYGPEGTLYKEI
jgi:hypothetical protein